MECYPGNDIPSSDPTVRWPNEGLTIGNTRRRRPYDDLSMAQWVVGQATNISQVTDITMIKHMLTQLIQTMKDACSLPWPQVREAYGDCMQELEEGRLQWEDTVQWSFSRLNSGRNRAVISSVHTQATPSDTHPVNSSRSDNPRPCTYYMEGRCGSLISHPPYSHDLDSFQLRRSKRQGARGRVQQNVYYPSPTDK